MTTWGATSSDWVRRGKLLTAVGVPVGVVTTVVALTNNDAWVRVSAFALAVGALLCALVGVFFQYKENQSAGIEERAGLDVLLCVPVCDVGEVDPEAIGVDRAAPTELNPDGAMPYLPRDVDVLLRHVIDDALDGRGGWFIVLDGVAKTGKSRTLLEALQAAGRSERLHLLAPRGARELAKLLIQPSPIAVSGRMVLWLNDIELQIAAGLSYADLTRWRGLYAGGLVVGTHGGKTPETAAVIGETRLASLAGDLLNHGQTVPLGKTSATELARLPGSPSPGTRADLARFGLAAYLVAAPQVQSKVVAGVHPGHGSNEWGTALVSTVLDWARCGRTRPLPDELLRRLSTLYRSGSPPCTDEQFAAARRWAVLPLAGNVTVVHERDDGVTAFDYAVRVRGAQRPQPDIPIGVWEEAAASAESEEAELVGERAYGAGHRHVALDAFSAAASSTQPEVGATALYNKGVTLGLLGRSEEAVAVYDQVDSRYRDDPTPALREQVAKALVNKGYRLGLLGRSEEEVAVYDEVDSRYRDDPTPALREQVATALNNKGVLLTWLGHFDEAASAYQQSLQMRGDDANTLSNWAQLDFARGFDTDGTTKAYRALELSGNDPQLGPLRSESNFYLFAHNPQERMRSGTFLKQALRAGLSTGTWSFQPNIRRLRDIKDPRIGLIQALARAMAKGDPSELDAFDEWRDIPNDPPA